MRTLNRAFFIGIASVGLIGLSACASSLNNLQRETARSLGVSPSAVSVAEIDRGMMSVEWTAIVDGEEYSCSADDMVRRTHCVPAEE